MACRAQISLQWAPIQQLTRLVVASIPHGLKASCLRALGAFAADSHVANQIWAQLESVNMLQGYAFYVTRSAMINRFVD